MEQKRTMIAVIALLIAMLGITVTANSAAAALPTPNYDPSWAKWKFDLTVLDKDIEATWYVTIGGEDKRGAPVDLHVEAIPLACQLVGNADVTYGVLHLDGGHVECLFPDLLTTANTIITDLWGTHYTLQFGPDCECAPIRLGYVTANVTPTGQGKNPVFHHPQIQFDLNVNKNGVQNDFEFSALTSVGPFVSGSPSSYESRYFCDASQGSCFFEHYAGGGQGKSDKRNYAISQFYVGSVTVYIGYDPTTNQHAEAALSGMIVDPGCRVN